MIKVKLRCHTCHYEEEGEREKSDEPGKVETWDGLRCPGCDGEMGEVESGEEE